MPKKIIILGASGFIGGYLLKNFSANISYDVKGYSSKECNLLSLKSVDRALSSTTPDDVIIMTSAITRQREDSFGAMIKNILMAENVSKFIEQHYPSPLIIMVYLNLLVNLFLKNIVLKRTFPSLC
jgi:nucleoside-diphosphate-sugar epimerase